MTPFAFMITFGPNPSQQGKEQPANLWIWRGLGSVGRMLLKEQFSRSPVSHLFREFVGRGDTYGVWVSVASMQGSGGCHFPFPRGT